MKYILVSLFVFAKVSLFAEWEWNYEHVPLSELKQIDAQVYYDDKFSVFIKYQDHWYQVLNTDHHVLCPCYYEVQYHKDLCQELYH